MVTSLDGILESLQKFSDEKKNHLTSRSVLFHINRQLLIFPNNIIRYEDSSKWLANELDILRQLIAQNPRDAQNINKTTDVIDKNSGDSYRVYSNCI